MKILSKKQMQIQSLKKTIVVAVMAMGLVVFTGCGSSPDTKSPQIETSQNALYSVFDTVFVRFNEPVPSFDENNYSAIPALAYKRINDREYAFYGDARYWGGFDMMRSDTEYEITFKDIADKAGNEAAEMKFTFKTMPLLDSDMEELENGDISDNGKINNADVLADASEFFEGTVLNKGLTIAGALTANSVGDGDFADYYVIQARRGDSLEITLDGFEGELALVFKGPRNINAVQDKQEYDDSLAPDPKTGIAPLNLKFSIDANWHTYGTNNVSDYLEYWIGVTYKSIDVSTFNKQTVYSLSVKRL
jgi:hypothetical protein